MQTVFVNPGTKSKRKRRSVKRRTIKRKTPKMSRETTRRKRRNVAINNNPRRRRYTRRRRNAGITPFVSNKQNPLILQNPRRRKRRKNPTMNFNTFISRSLTYSGGAAVGAGLNILVIRRIENDWLRNGARLAAAVGSGMLLKGEMGAAAAGATLYPLFAELALMLNIVPGTGAGTTGTEADLNELAADLESALNELDYDEDEMYVP